MNVNWKAEINRCAKCGKCRSVCPVFIETGDESMVARGRISLAEAVLDGTISPNSEKFERYIQSCLKCLRCAAVCPPGVNYEAILHAVRELIAEELGVPIYARAIFRAILPRRGLFDLAIKAAALADRFIPTKKRGSMRHLPLFFMGRRWIPPLAKKTVLSKHYEQKFTKPKMRVAFFVGCLINYVYTDIADAAINVLERLGIEVIIPSGQLCCGTPVVSYGDAIAAKRLAARNVDVLNAEKVDAIVVACASCGQTLKNEYQQILGNDFNRFNAPVLDIAELISQRLFRKEPEQLQGKPVVPSELEVIPLPMKVTYHDPCHLRWGQNIVSQPRSILQSSADYVEMPNAERCCGGGGAFSLFHYDLSMRISEHKLDAIRKTDADLIATGCPGCRLHISDRLADNNIVKDTLHTVQILEMALKDNRARIELNPLK